MATGKSVHRTTSGRLESTMISIFGLLLAGLGIAMSLKESTESKELMTMFGLSAFILLLTLLSTDIEIVIDSDTGRLVAHKLHNMTGKRSLIQDVALRDVRQLAMAVHPSRGEAKVRYSVRLLLKDRATQPVQLGVGRTASVAKFVNEVNAKLTQLGFLASAVQTSHSTVIFTGMAVQTCEHCKASLRASCGQPFRCPLCRGVSGLDRAVVAVAVEKPGMHCRERVVVGEPAEEEEEESLSVKLDMPDESVHIPLLPPPGL
eukprot:PLAT1706.1.p1 GENE.PLAT1706.1~~PLAT1706.1.p1  ORF type:complete len:261 (+),score=31.05 PLAT1706.1:50-832(+)